MNSNDQDILAYIKHNPVAIIGTVNGRGIPHGAAVYVCANSAERLYFLTKTETVKYQNLLAHPHVSVTIVNSEDNSTLQSEGTAETVEDSEVIGDVMQK